MRLPPLNELPFNSIQRIPASQDGWSSFVRRNVVKERTFQLVNEIGVVALYLTPPALRAAMPGEENPSLRLRRNPAFRLEQLSPAEAHVWLRDIPPSALTLVLNPHTSRLLGLIVPVGMMEALREAA